MKRWIVAVLLITTYLGLVLLNDKARTSSTQALIPTPTQVFMASTQETGHSIPPTKIETGIDNARAIDWSADGVFLVVATDEGFSLIDSSAQEELPITHYPTESAIFSLESWDDLVIAGSERGRIYLLDTAVRLNSGILFAHDTPVMSIAVSPSEAILATGAFGEVKLWDIESKALLQSFDWNSGLARVPITDLAFSEDGVWLLIGSLQGIQQRNIQTGESLNDSEGIATARTLTKFEISPASSFLAYGLTNGLIRVWEGDNWNQAKYLLRGHSAQITGLAFNQDENLLVSIDEDGSIKLWNLQDGTELPLDLAENSEIVGAKFHAGDGSLAGLDKQGNLFIWETGFSE